MSITPDLIANLVVMAGVTYLIRVIPFVAFRKKIQNRFIRSFLYYIPYAVLAAMTVPAIFSSTSHLYSALVGGTCDGILWTGISDGGIVCLRCRAACGICGEVFGIGSCPFFCFWRKWVRKRPLIVSVLLCFSVFLRFFRKNLPFCYLQNPRNRV